MRRFTVILHLLVLSALACAAIAAPLEGKAGELQAEQSIVLVAGATGRLGRYVIAALAQEGFAVRGLTRDPAAALEKDGDRYLPIWINTPEATAIALGHDGIRPERPLTHDLLTSLIEELGAQVSEVVVTELRGGTFYADLRLKVGDEIHSISSRPSDAVAIAVRTDAPVFASRDLLDEAGVHIRDEEDEDEIAKFREFLDRIEPEDFEHGKQQ